MNHYLKTFAVTLMALGMMALVACNKDDNTEKTPVITSLASTSWQGSTSASIPMGNISIPVTVVSELTFADTHNANFAISVEGMPLFALEAPVTYTWNGDNQGMLHFTGRFQSGDVTMAAIDASHLTANLTAVVVDDSTGQAASVFQMLGGTIPFQYTKIAE